MPSCSLLVCQKSGWNMISLGLVRFFQLEIRHVFIPAPDEVDPGGSLERKKIWFGLIPEACRCGSNPNYWEGEKDWNDLVLFWIAHIRTTILDTSCFNLNQIYPDETGLFRAKWTLYRVSFMWMWETCYRNIFWPINLAGGLTLLANTIYRWQLFYKYNGILMREDTCWIGFPLLPVWIP